MNKLFILCALSIVILTCKPQADEPPEAFEVAYEKFELDNGLDVVFHVDRSDPVVAVLLMFHVGSAREKTQRTGFAHLFEHLLFLGSENLGMGGLENFSARIGGSMSGVTNRDRTVYHQTVPNDALEKALWAEADKLGWFINTVADQLLAKEKQVVKNEKRQLVDNQPYGHTRYVIVKNLYPSDHPYNWRIIGSMEDLQSATVDDVKDFYSQWYVPNNASLIVSGDFDTRQTKEWIHKYFDEIKRGKDIAHQEKKQGVIPKTLKLHLEDNFAKLPELTLAWPSVERFHPDSYPLEVLSKYLVEGKGAPLNKTLVEKDKLTSIVRMNYYRSELAAEISLSIRAFEGIHLETVLRSIQNGFEIFEQNGLTVKDLQRTKAIQETQFYNRFSTVWQKGYNLAEYNIYTGNPGYVHEELNRMLNVTVDDVIRVYNTYIKGANYIATSFIPKGKLDLALNNSTKAEVVEEKVMPNAEESFDLSEVSEYERTPSTFDRSVEPPFGDPPLINVPTIWEHELSNGLQVFGIESLEVPLVHFTINIEGGVLFDGLDKVGVAHITSQLLTKGTKNKTPEELENSLQELGATIKFNSYREIIGISGNTLAKNFTATIQLLEEMIVEPRWDALEFELIKNSTLNFIRQQSAEPNWIAINKFFELIYGEEDIRSKNRQGTQSSVEAITLDDLKNYYAHFFSPSIASMHVVGAVDRETVKHALVSIEQKWKAKEVNIPEFTIPNPPLRSNVYFYDIPNAKQSVFYFGNPALTALDNDYYAATVMNYILGGGGFASQLMQQLREEKGYTYRAKSTFEGKKTTGDFSISSSVRTNITLEAAQLVKEILINYADNYDESDMEITKGALIKSNARAFEAINSKLDMLTDISHFGWAHDYVKEREQIVEEMSVARIKELAQNYIDPDRMIWLVVGDAKSQLHRLENLGYGKPILLNDMESAK